MKVVMTDKEQIIALLAHIAELKLVITELIAVLKGVKDKNNLNVNQNIDE
jgi:hypothetical protein